MFKIHEVKVFAKSCENFNITCLTFLKIENQYCSVSFYPVFTFSENKETNEVKSSLVKNLKVLC